MSERRATYNARPTPPESVAHHWTTRVVLPFPPSANVYWRHDRGVTHRSDGARRYIGDVGVLLAHTRLPREHKGERLALALVVYFPVPVRGDLDNRIKVCVDALAQALEMDDRRIWSIEAVRRYDKSNPRILVRLSDHEDKGETPALYGEAAS